MHADRILTTHAGSLPRSRPLTELHLAKARGDAVDEAALSRAAGAAAEEVLARQIEVGLDIVNDGEMGRESFFTYVRRRMSGFSGESRRHDVGDVGFAQHDGEQSVLVTVAHEDVGEAGRDDRTEAVVEQRPRCVLPR